MWELCGADSYLLRNGLFWVEASVSDERRRAKTMYNSPEGCLAGARPPRLFHITECTRIPHSPASTSLPVTASTAAALGRLTALLLQLHFTHSLTQNHDKIREAGNSDVL